MKVSDLQDRFRRHALNERGITARAVKAVESSLRMLCEHLQTEELSDLTTSAIRDFLYAGREEKLWKPKTFRNHRQNLKSFFSWCIREGLMRKNPTDQIESPKLEKPLPRCLTREEAKKIIYHTRWIRWRHEIEASRNETILSTFIFTGLRLQELIDLEIHDVNLESGEIFVREGKGKKDRIIPIHHHLLPILRNYLKARIRLGKPSQWFFTGAKSDKKLRPENIHDFIKKVRKVSEVYFSPHMLRHTFGRLIVEDDFSVEKLRVVMGHSCITTTQRYMYVSSASIKESFDKVKIL